tara:strand:- start:900 stop:1187 length:288 start_codon:yes stop_codon:yes gene_type:complete
MNNWVATRIGALIDECSLCYDPVYWESGKKRNAQDGERHGCTYADALAASRRRLAGPIPTYERELIEELYSSDIESELPESADEEWTVKVEVERP